MTRQMVMIGFLQAQNCTNLPCSWRHPESRDDAHTADYYQEIARVLEAGRFHMAFFDDRLAMPDRYRNDHRPTVEFGIRTTKMDPLIVLMTMAAVTTRLGLASTCSTTYFEPFDVARRFATLDLMTNGRAAWNVVTSVNDGEALNMGRDEHLAHDLRYDRADEFMDVVLGHWDTWDDGAIIIDKRTGRYADPGKVKRLDHRGKFFASRGPFTVPRSPQGHPVIVQAGASGRGRRFAGRWGEVIFTAARSVELAKEGYQALKGEAARLGRDPDQVSICNILIPVAGATRAEAEDKMATISKLPLEIDALSLLAEALNFDFASKGIDEPFTTEELNGMQGMLGVRDSVLKRSGKANPSTRDFITYSGRGQVESAIVGGPKEIADVMEDVFASRGCDGFVVAATHVPGAYADFVAHVVPELQRRGLYQRDYRGMTLRENLGLPRPTVGAWKVSQNAAKLESTMGPN
jgi:FMN-dependent oxidoreductase (nitrilotriacetate monooxygenase family)